MAKPKVQAYIVTVDVKVDVNVRVSGESFEDALAQARELTVPEILKNVDGFNDYDAPKVTGIFTA